MCCLRLRVGNKCDMSDKRQVPTERAQQLAIEHRIAFQETSAKENVNVESAFMNLTRAILSRQQQRQTGRDEDIVTPEDPKPSGGGGWKCCSK